MRKINERALPLVETVIAAIAAVAIAVYLLLWFRGSERPEVPLYVAIAAAIPLLWRIVKRLLKLKMTADLLAGISVLAAVLLGEYLAATIVVLMLATGQALEAYAIRRASFALDALAKRLPSVAHLASGSDVKLDAVKLGDELIVHPHEICPVDGSVVSGYSTMNEAYLTGEPYLLPKAVGSQVLSGAVNGEGLLTVRAEKLAGDSRYARIMEVMRDAEEKRPQLRRLGDQIGAVYTFVIMAVALVVWFSTGIPDRFLSIIVVATPCPIIIGIPVAVIGSISTAARLGIIVKDPAVLEKIASCTVAIFDKTGTLTYGEPRLVEIETADPHTENDILALVASLERYSRHPLAKGIVTAAEERGISLRDVAQMSERPGTGLTGVVDRRSVEVTGRKLIEKNHPDLITMLPLTSGGLECVIVVDGRYAALLRFRDAPREDGPAFVKHLGPEHGFRRLMLVSGDRESEVQYLAEGVGIHEIHAGQSPEQKLELVRQETLSADTLFMGDGINDAPALTAATVGIAFGQASDVTSEAASAVVLDNSLKSVDELLHIGLRMRRIALQSSIGGIVLSLVGVVLAAMGMLPPVAGAITQEAIDLLAILNALRTSYHR